MTVRQAQETLEIATHGPGLVEFTDRAARWLAGQGVETGLLTLFVRHTSASLTIQENADPACRHDLEAFLARLVPQEAGRYRHRSEGLDDMPAHIRSALTDASLSVPVAGGSMVLGTWQGLYLFEHRDSPHRRQVVLHLVGA